MCLKAYKQNIRDISHQLLDHPDIDLYAENAAGVPAILAAFSNHGNEKIAIKITRHPKFDMDTVEQNVKSSALKLAGLWEWKTVELAFIERDIDQLFAIADDGFNYLTRFAFNGRRSEILRLLDVLKNEGERLRRSVGEGSKLKRPPSLRQIAARANMRQSDVRNRIESTADINNDRGLFYHLLHLCAQQDWEDIVDLLEKRFDVHGLPRGDHVGRTMLHWAVENSWNYALRDFSTQSREWLDYQDRDGATALHLACSLQNRKVAQHLVDSGASYHLKDKHGKTPGLILFSSILRLC